MVAIGTQAGVRTEPVITDMNAPLGRAVGNALEIIECLETLKGTGPTELTAVIRVLATTDGDAGRIGARRSMPPRVEWTRHCHQGARSKSSQRLIERQGGDRRVVDDYSRLPSAPDRERRASARAPGM